MSSKKDNINTVDINFLRQALNLAIENDGLTGQNPSVGCLITSNNKIISQGVTSVNGRPHAEFNALNKIKKKTKKSTMYVTMEPCDHFGKTPPCTDIIIKSNISRVVYGVEDIDKRTYFKACSKLRSEGIKVKRSVNKKEITNFYKKYFFCKKNNMPYVTGKIACSKDNFIYSKNKKYITNEYSLDVSHLLRYKNEGILVSYKTLNKDNPYLTCRLNGLEKFSPKRFIIDKNLKSKKNLNIFKDKNKNKTYIFHDSNNFKKINFFKKRKIKLIKIKSKNNKIDFFLILSRIYKLNISRLLVEGGRKLTDNFIKNRLFNEFYLFKSSKSLKNSGSINIKDTIKKISLNFKNNNLLDTYTEEDKITKYF